MNHIPSTTAILAYKVLNRLTDPLWLAWAVDQIESGENTRIWTNSPVTKNRSTILK
jgi:hypothetical protein